MPKFKVHLTLDHTDIVEAEGEESAVEKVWDEVFARGYAGVETEDVEEG